MMFCWHGLFFFVFVFFTANVEDELNTTEPGEDKGKDFINHDLLISAARIQRIRFPTYVPPNCKDDMVRKWQAIATAYYLIY